MRENFLEKLCLYSVVCASNNLIFNFSLGIFFNKLLLSLLALSTSPRMDKCLLSLGFGYIKVYNPPSPHLPTLTRILF